MKGHAVLMSTGKDDWETPPALFAALDAEFGFTLDVAADETNTKCEVYIDAASDALTTAWEFMGEYPRTPVCWCNPPYSRGLQGKFIAKAAAERLNGVTTVMLLPARTDTRAFHGCIWNEFEHGPREGVEVRFLRGRLRFVGAPASAPFPSMIVIFRGAEGKA